MTQRLSFAVRARRRRRTARRLRMTAAAAELGEWRVASLDPKSPKIPELISGPQIQKRTPCFPEKPFSAPWACKKWSFQPTKILLKRLVLWENRCEASPVHQDLGCIADTPDPGEADPVRINQELVGAAGLTLHVSAFRTLFNSRSDSSFVEALAPDNHRNPRICGTPAMSVSIII